MRARPSLLCLCFLFVGWARAQESKWTVQDVTEQLQRHYLMIDDAVAQFDQHVRFGFSNIEQTFSGTLTMKKPNHYRIESEHQTIITDGQSVWAYSPVNKQVVIDRFKENQNSISPEHFMLNIPDNYFASLLGAEHSGETQSLTLKLVPKDDRSFVKSVKLWVDEKRWVIRRIVIVDVNDTETTYTVRDVKLNTNVSDNAFVFTPPAGTEIVDLR